MQHLIISYHTYYICLNVIFMHICCSGEVFLDLITESSQQDLQEYPSVQFSLPTSLSLSPSSQSKSILRAKRGGNRDSKNRGKHPKHSIYLQNSSSQVSAKGLLGLGSSYLNNLYNSLPSVSQLNPCASRKRKSSEITIAKGIYTCIIYIENKTPLKPVLV